MLLPICWHPHMHCAAATLIASCSPSSCLPPTACRLQGDSGGPVIRPSLAGDVVVGITSFGSSGCSKDYAYYVRTAYHLSWIDARMKLPIPEASAGLPGMGGGSQPAAILTPVKDWFNSLH